MTMDRNTLYYGDNLAILREHIASESVDLVYLDPPFNSNRSYNVLFKDESGKESQAQIAAFDDTWLRPDGKPLSKSDPGRDFWRRELQERDRLEAVRCSQ